MSLTKRFYSGVFLKALSNSNVKGSDNIKTVFSKLRANTDDTVFNKLAPFIKKYWGTERQFVDKGIKMMKASITGNIKDPALDSAIMIKTPTDNLVSVDNTLFSSCNNCHGRTYPGFQFCPHCGYTLLHEPKAPEAMLPLSDMPVPFSAPTNLGNFGMGGPTNGYMSSPQHVSVMPRSPAVGPLGRGSGLRSKSDIPVKDKHEVIHDIDGHKITSGDIDRELKTIHRHIPTR